MNEFDAVFLARLRRREESAFRELVLGLEGQVFRLVARMLGNSAEAEEMTQEIFVQVWKSLDSFRGESKLSTWVFRIAVNLTKNRTKYLSRRHQRSHSDIDDAEPRERHLEAQGTTVGEVPRPDQSAVGHQTEALVREAFAALPQEFREILVLRDIEGLPYGEIMAITELAEGTVKSRLHRARSELRALVEARLGEKLP